MVTWCIVSGVSRFCSVLLIIRIVVLTLIIWVPDMGLIDFYLIFSMCDVNVDDLVNLPVVYSLFGYDLRLKIRCFLEGRLQILW